MLCDWLETQGHEVLSAEDLQTAWRTLGHQEPDLVLLDVQLGNEDALGGTATTAAKTLSYPRDCRDGRRYGDGTAALS